MVSRENVGPRRELSFSVSDCLRCSCRRPSGKRPEIVTALEKSGAVLNGIRIERSLDPSDQILGKSCPTNGGLVKIASRQGRMTGMKPCGIRFDGQDVNVGRQAFVDLPLNLFDGLPECGPKMSNPGQGMHTGVGPSGPSQIDVLTKKVFGSFSQIAPNSSTVGWRRHAKGACLRIESRP